MKHLLLCGLRFLTALKESLKGWRGATYKTIEIRHREIEEVTMFWFSKILKVFPMFHSYILITFYLNDMLKVHASSIMRKVTFNFQNHTNLSWHYLSSGTKRVSKINPNHSTRSLIDKGVRQMTIAYSQNVLRDTHTSVWLDEMIAQNKVCFWRRSQSLKSSPTRRHYNNFT